MLFLLDLLVETLQVIFKQFHRIFVSADQDIGKLLKSEIIGETENFFYGLSGLIVENNPKMDVVFVWPLNRLFKWPHAFINYFSSQQSFFYLWNLLFCYLFCWKMENAALFEGTKIFFCWLVFTLLLPLHLWRNLNESWALTILSLMVSISLIWSPFEVIIFM